MRKRDCEKYVRELQRKLFLGEWHIVVVAVDADELDGEGVPYGVAEGTMAHCSRCNTTRKGNFCWKCGTPTFEPDHRYTKPKKPSVKAVREAAREVGYAIGEHGSKERDVDLIAAPWTEDAVTADELIAHLCRELGAVEVGGKRSDKPYGRVATTLLLNGWYKLIDLSICPMTKRE